MVPKIGMRKIKSIIAVAFVFIVWQIVRIWFPQFEVHPLFGYIYAVIEMRETVEKTRQFGYRRIKTTLIGLAIGMMFLPLSELFGIGAGTGIVYGIIDLALILIGVLISLWVAELLKCQNFCGIAAIIFVICMVRDRNADVNIYLYAILRVFQTVIGVFAAWLVNKFVNKNQKKKDAACG